MSSGDSDVVVNEVVGKSLLVYTDMMSKTFSDYYRMLKPGKWMTVEFHNSKASIWNSIQEAIGKAGFVIVHVATLNKKQKTFTKIHVSGTINQYLIIYAYKPNGGLEDRFKLKAGTEDSVWDFVHTHLKQLPVFVSKTVRPKLSPSGKTTFFSTVWWPSMSNEVSLSHRGSPKEMECFSCPNSWPSTIRSE
jgi:hypothetical protein